MPKQREMFIRAGVLNIENGKYYLTREGQNLIDKYTEIVNNHRNSAGDSFNIERKKIADVSLYQAVNYMSDEINEYIVIDIETTGLDFYFDDVIQISAARYIDGCLLYTSPSPRDQA